jgi:hypothetical protein
MKQTTVTLIFEKFNLLSDRDFKSWMLNNYDELFEMEKEQIINARDTAPYSMFERIGEAENYYNQTFKSE